MKTGFPQSSKSGEKYCFKTVDKAVLNDNGVPLSERVGFKNYTMCIIGDGVVNGSLLPDSSTSFSELLGREFYSYAVQGMSSTTMANVDKRPESPRVAIVNRWMNLGTIYVDSDNTYYDINGTHYTEDGISINKISTTELNEKIASGEVLQSEKTFDVILIACSSNDWIYNVPIGEDLDTVARISYDELDKMITEGTLTINPSISYTDTDGSYYDINGTHYAADGTRLGAVTLDMLRYYTVIGRATSTTKPDRAYLASDGTYYSITGRHYSAIGAELTGSMYDKNTFRGALNLVIDGLLTKYAGKEIVFITPLGRNSTSDIYGSSDNKNEVGHTLEDYVEVIKQSCAKRAIPVIDMHSRSGLDFVHNVAHRTMLSVGDPMANGVHPNTEGHYRLYKHIFKELLAII